MSKKVLFSLCLLLVLLPAIALAAKSYSYYKNSQYNFQFKYPSTWTAHQSEDGAIYSQTDYFPITASLMGYSFVLQTVAMPENSYPNTNFKQAYATVAANKTIGSLDDCKLYSPEGDLKTLNVKKKFNGILFYTGKTLTRGAAGTMLQTKIYHTFYNSTCYEMNLNLVTGSIYNYPAGTKKVNEIKIWRQLQTVLRTFAFIDQSSGWQTYKNKDYNFSIQYPKNLDSLANEGSSNYEDRLVSLTIGTPEYIQQLKTAEGVEFTPFFNLVAHEPNYEITDECPEGAKNLGVIIIGGIKTTKCQDSNLGSPQLYINFTKDEVLYYTIKSDTYFTSSSDKAMIDEIIGTFIFLPIKLDNEYNNLQTKNYSNTQLGYSLSYPANFYQTSLPDVPTHDVYFKSENVNSPVDMSDQAMWITIRVSNNPNHLTLDQWAHNNINGSYETTFKTLTINGQQAVQVKAKNVGENHYGDYMVTTYFSSGETVYSIESFTRSVSVFNELQEYYAIIVNSFILI